MDLTQATDELFSAPWDGFVEARARLAVELAQAGKRDDSRALKKLRRPTAAAWATNQVVRRARPAVEAFLAGSDLLRARQAAVLEGGGDRAAYQAAAEAFRQATAALGQAARQVLQHAGREADRALVDGVVSNVRAAALTDERRAELLAGRLLADIVAGEGGLEGLFGASLAAGAAASAPVARAPAPEAPPSPAGAKVLQFDVAAQKARKAEAQARAQREEHARRVTAAKDDEATAVDAAASAAAVAAQARTARETAEDRVREVEAAPVAARQALDEATAAERTATQASGEAAAGASRATQRRAALEREAPP